MADEVSLESDPALPYRMTGVVDRATIQHLALFALVLLVITIALVIPVFIGIVDSTVLNMITPVVMWFPTLILLLLHHFRGWPSGFLRTAAATPLRPLWPILTTSAALLAALSALAVLTEGLAVLFSLKSAAVSPDAMTLLSILPVFIAFTMIQTAGEEFAWRGYAQTLLAPWGYWRASAVIGAFWVVWHLPLTVSYALAGDILLREIVATSVNLFLAAFVLSGARYLSASVWPAVFGHALLNTVLVFVYSNFTTTIGAAADVTFWVYTAMSWLLWLILIGVVALVVRRQNTLDPPG